MPDRRIVLHGLSFFNILLDNTIIKISTYHKLLYSMSLQYLLLLNITESIHYFLCQWDKRISTLINKRDVTVNDDDIKVVAF